MGLEPRKILEADRAVPLALAKRGGMRPEPRVFRWLEIARITLDRFAGSLDGILREPYAKANQALKQFPNIGEPAAERILLFCGVGEGLPLDWNGCRVRRVGYGRPQPKNYGAQYRPVDPGSGGGRTPNRPAALARAHLLLRQHGKTICKENGPACGECTAPVCADPGRDGVAVQVKGLHRGICNYTWNELPQPQVDFTWGLLNLKPEPSSVST